MSHHVHVFDQQTECCACGLARLGVVSLQALPVAWRRYFGLETRQLPSVSGQDEKESS